MAVILCVRRGVNRNPFSCSVRFLLPSFVSRSRRSFIEKTRASTKRLDRAKHNDEKNPRISAANESIPVDTQVHPISSSPAAGENSDSSSTNMQTMSSLTSAFKDDYPNWTFEGTSERNCRTNKLCLTDSNLLERTDDIDSFLQSVGLQGNEDFLFSANARTVAMGLGWARLESPLLTL